MARTSSIILRRASYHEDLRRGERDSGITAYGVPGYSSCDYAMDNHPPDFKNIYGLWNLCNKRKWSTEEEEDEAKEDVEERERERQDREDKCEKRERGR